MNEALPIMAFVIIIICIIGLWFGANWVVDSAITVVAIGTSAPEFAVTISSALSGQSDISVGNVIGSNIFNLGFILGGLALFAGITTTRNMVFRDGSMLIATTILLIIFLFDLTLSQLEGMILLAILVAYIGYLLYRGVETHEELSRQQFRWTDIPLWPVSLVSQNG